MSASTGADAVRGWLEGFAACVRGRDVECGRAMFAEDCVSFGTRGERLDGLDDLVARQWAPIWSTTEGFCFLVEGCSVASSQDGSMVAVAALWESAGIADDGARFERRGRASIILAPDPSAPHGMRAVHTHFSLRPDPLT